MHAFWGDFGHTARSGAAVRAQILHLTDVHATGGGALYGSIHPLRRLRQTADLVRAQGVRPLAVVVSGDLVDRHDPAPYAVVTRALAHVEAVLDAPVLTVLGNHDDPAAAVALPGHATHHYRSVRVEGLRFLLCDSHAGMLEDAQLDWLARELHHPAAAGSVLVVHHPPIASAVPGAPDQSLRGAGDLAAALAGGDVRAILCGHYHHAMAGTFAGVPVWCGPALAYQRPLGADPADALEGAGAYTLVDLAESGMRAVPLPLRNERPVWRLARRGAEASAPRVLGAGSGDRV